VPNAHPPKERARPGMCTRLHGEGGLGRTAQSALLCPCREPWRRKRTTDRRVPTSAMLVEMRQRLMVWYGAHPWKYMVIAASVGAVLGVLLAQAFAGSSWMDGLPLKMAIGGATGAFFDSRALRARRTTA